MTLVGLSHDVAYLRIRRMTGVRSLVRQKYQTEDQGEYVLEES